MAWYAAKSLSDSSMVDAVADGFIPASDVQSHLVPDRRDAGGAPVQAAALSPRRRRAVGGAPAPPPPRVALPAPHPCSPAASLLLPALPPALSPGTSRGAAALAPKARQAALP
eukprot:CAMPEP_0180651034 /NCGR_PEP_ID=MMETSP1037_2-20121125/52612_1 /TAXON_ID=632150 /ORGANISM="Azadinium spinosum, Strain 3D9" /LENGTH=112 /DNA_ID=CAMNT_0022676541 /DNA_START=268 /DNA_END=604 /DNA_ORIENTATION=+